MTVFLSHAWAFEMLEVATSGCDTVNGDLLAAVEDTFFDEWFGTGHGGQ